MFSTFFRVIVEEFDIDIYKIILLCSLFYIE